MNREVENFLSSFPFADTTKDSYRRTLVRLLKAVDLEKLDAAGLLRFVAVPEWGTNQRYTALCACRRFIAWKFGDHPSLSARLKQGKPKRQRVLSVEKALELLASFDTSTRSGARDLAIAAVALDTGLRLAELCRLRLLDVDLDRRVLQVIVKGGQWGNGVFSANTALYISNWLAFRDAAPNVETLFISFQHQRVGLPLTREGLQELVKRWGLRIGIRLSPHDFRRSFATLSTIFGAPSRVVQEAGRWSTIEMVERYTRGLDQSEIVPYLPLTKLRE